MADSPWEELDAASTDAYESEYRDPDHTYSSPTRTDRTEETRPDGTRVTTTTLIIANVNVRGEMAAAELVHKCNRCGGHEHSLRADLGFTVDVPYEPLHVAENKFGQGRGILYCSVRVTGSLVRRVETRTRAAAAAAPQVSVTWEQKLLDHVEQRDLVELEAFDSIVDCTLGVEESSLGYAVPDTELFALALARVPTLAKDVAWVDEGRVLPDLADALRGVERPLFRFVAGERGDEMVLEARTGEGATELGRVALEVSKDRKHVTARRYTPTGKS